MGTITRSATALLRAVALGIFCLTLAGCGNGASNGGGGSSTPPVTPSFTLSISPSSLNLTQQGASQPVQIGLVTQGGFTGTVNVSAGTLPSGLAISPSSLTISAGSPAAINFSASSTAPISQQAITFQGTSGTLSASASLQITVQGGAVPDPFHYVGGELVHGFYDESRQLLFATNLGLNELDVISGKDYSLKARIHVPQPVGIDQMADGNTLVIGTSAQELVTVDENTYAVTAHPFSAVGNGTYTLFFPTVVAMANGKVFAIGQEQGIESNEILDGGQTLFQWNSLTDTFTQIAPAPGPLSLLIPWETDRLARSADHKWAVFAADQFYLYGSDTDSFTTATADTVDPPDNEYGVRGYALNSDGSVIAVASAAQVSFFDRSFHLLGTAQLPGAFQTARSNVQFSSDGSKVYLQYAFPLAAEAVDVTSFTALGYLSATVVPDGDNLEGLLSIDAEGRGWFNIDGGVRLVDLSQPLVPNVSGTAFPGASCSPLDVILPLNTTQQVQLAQPISSGSVYIGGQPATISSGGTQVAVPASAAPGSADQECIDTQGNTAVVAQAVSYGVDPVGLSANLLPPTGQAGAYVFGFGFSESSSGTPPSVTVGNAQSPQVVSLGSPGLGVFQGEQIQIPNGTPGQSADLTVSSSLGSGTLHSAAAYYATPTILPTSGILQLVFDTHRNRLYALKANEVDVLDAGSLQWLPPFTFPAGFSATVESMAITPDGSKLAVLALAGSEPEMIVLDPSGSSPASVTSYSGKANLYGSMAITNQNTILMIGPYGLLFNLSTQSFSPWISGSEVIRASADGSHVYMAAMDDSGGTVYSIDPSTLAIKSEGFGQLFWSDFAVSTDGSQFAAVSAKPGTPGDLVGFFNSSLQYVNANAYPDYSPPDDAEVPGATYSPGGKVLMVPQGDSIELWDANLGTLRARLMTPEELPILVYPNTALDPMIALNAAGDTIFAVSASGLTVIPLPGPVDQIAPEQWPEYRSGGISPAFRGSLATRMKAMAAAKSKKTASDGVR
jgi:hypothetical protein